LGPRTGRGNEMKGKLRILGAGVLAVVAVGAVAAGGASAVTPANSHFTTEAPEHHVILKGTETFPGNHNLSLQRTVGGQASGEPWKCTHVGYHGTLSGVAVTTTQSISLRPDYTGLNNCSTGAIPPHNMVIHVPTGCGTDVLQFTSGNPGTMHLLCPITITHPNCEMRVPAQTKSGVTYTTVVEGNRHALTLDINFQSTTVHFESGFCVFLGTVQTFHTVGSITLWGEDTLGNRVGITHT
jgi:hypothetical protein